DRTLVTLLATSRPVPRVLPPTLRSPRPFPCFSSWDRDHLDLPSFPTRRSSDLSADFVMTPTQAMLDELRQYVEVPDCKAVVNPRSEEHTSELQSPDHLVCRLLLEKKKEEYSTLTRADRHNESIDTPVASKSVRP